MILIRIPGEPVPWARVRVGNGTFFTAKKVRDHQARIKSHALMAMKGRNRIMDGAIRMTVLFVFSVPISWPAWKQKMALRGMIAFTMTPDEDNLVKCVKDALNPKKAWKGRPAEEPFVWKDDSYVTTRPTRRYGPEPYTEALIEEIDGVWPAQITKNPFGRGADVPDGKQEVML